jgi:hypothetical protein
MKAINNVLETKTRIYSPSIIITRQVNILDRTKLAKWIMQIFRPANQASMLKRPNQSSKCHTQGTKLSK